MKAIEIYNPLSAFGNSHLIKVLAEERLEIERKENPCRGCKGKSVIEGICDECDGSGKTMNMCDDCEGTGIEKK